MELVLGLLLDKKYCNHLLALINGFTRTIHLRIEKKKTNLLKAQKLWFSLLQKRDYYAVEYYEFIIDSR